MYFVKRVLKRLLSGARLYVVIILEFAIGIGILACNINVLRTDKENLARAKQELANQKINVSVSDFMGMDYSQQPAGTLKITLEDYNYIKEKYGDILNCDYLVITMSQCAVMQTQSFYTFSYMFTDDAGFAKISSQKRDNSAAYAGADFIKAANESWQAYQQDSKGVSFFTKAITAKTNEVFIGEDAFAVSALEPLPNMAGTIIEDNVGNMYPLGTCAVLPLDAIPKLQSAMQRLDDPMMTLALQSMLTLEYKNADFEGNVVPEILEYLSLQHPKHKYEVEDKYLTLEANIRENSAAIYRQTAVAIATLIVVVLTAVGILMILLDKRKKAMAISLVYGATLPRVSAELLCEVLIVFELGALLGLLGAVLVNPSLTSANIGIVFHKELFYLMPIIAGASALISALPAIISMCTTSIIKTLKED